jgi:hypothetical protein
MNEEEDEPNLPELSNITKTVNGIIETALDDSAKKDFEQARANIHDLIENGKDAMDKLALIADSSQHPRAYEVLSKLMETMLQANRDLMDLQSKVREIKAIDQPINGARTINNNLFVGSTAELQKMIKNIREGDGSIQ